MMQQSQQQLQLGGGGTTRATSAVAPSSPFPALTRTKPVSDRVAWADCLARHAADLDQQACASTDSIAVLMIAGTA